MSRRRMVGLTGDPFLGFIGRALGSAFRVVAPALGLSLPAPTSQRGPFPPDIGPGFPFPPVGMGKSLPFPKKAPPFFPRTSVPGGLGPVAAGRRRRRMNPLNPRALRRALSRASSFARFARRALAVTFGKRPKVRFRLRRKKAS